MTPRNVMRIIHKLATKRELIKVWKHNRRANTYQLQCPELLGLGDLARAQEKRGVDLSDDKLSRDHLPRDKTGPDEPVSGDNLGAERVTNGHAEVLQPEQTTNSEHGPATPVDDVPKDTSPPWKKHGINFKAIGDEWNRVAEQCALAKIDKIDKTREAKIRTRRADPEFVWSKICAAIYISEGLHGQGWFTIDWLIANDNHWRRVLEMQYRRPKVKDGKGLAGSQTGGAMKELSDYGRGN